MNNPNTACEHGSQRRKCLICELTEEVKELREKNEMLREEVKSDEDELKAVSALIGAVGKRNEEIERLRKQVSEAKEWALTLHDKALVFDTIYDWYERMQLQSESYENELWRMDWLLKNPTKEYEDFERCNDECECWPIADKELIE